MNYAWDKGRDAFKQGLSLRDNPYDKEKSYRAWYDWNVGFEEEKLDRKELASLFDKLTRLEDAAKRGIEIDRSSTDTQGKVISPEQCEWTLKNCAMFRRWIIDSFLSN